jgi:ribosomal protein S18 acetylase RimI-like enzyme
VGPPRIRPVDPSDLDALYEICRRTGAAGEDATALVADPRLLGELFVAPYAVLEPEHAIVLDDGAGPQGYAVGALDTRAFEARLDAEWWPPLLERYPGPTGAGVLDDLFIGLIGRLPPAADDVVERFPSHLHIDLLPAYQSGGWGRRLLEVLFDRLRRAGSIGVHLGVSEQNQRAIGFYRHLGFEDLRGDGVTRTMGLPLGAAPS